MATKKKIVKQTNKRTPKRKLAVIAIGGNSLILDKNKQAVEYQWQAVVETATHCRKGVVERENWVKTQRLAALSYTTTGSPSLSVSHDPPKPAHSVLPLTNPGAGNCGTPALL